MSNNHDTNPKALNLGTLWQNTTTKVTLGFKCFPLIKLELAKRAGRIGITLSEYVENMVMNCMDQEPIFSKDNIRKIENRDIPSTKLNSDTYILQQDLSDGSKKGDLYRKLSPDYPYTNISKIQEKEIRRIDSYYVENNPELFVKVTEQPKEDAFAWDEKLVLLAIDLAHHNGWHKFPQNCIDLFDEIKTQAKGSGYQYPKWITDHISASKQTTTPQSEVGTFNIKEDVGSLLTSADKHKSPPPYPESWKGIGEKTEVSNGNSASNFESGDKEWEVDSFIHIDYGIMWKDAQGYYTHVSNHGRGWCISLEEALKNSNMKIHSVRRKSDNVVFSVKDKGYNFNEINKIVLITEENRMTAVCAKYGETTNHIGEICVGTVGGIPNILLKGLLKEQPIPEQSTVPISSKLMEQIGEERIKESPNQSSNGSGIEVQAIHYDGKQHTLVTNHRIYPSDYEKVKQAIENVLNGKEVQSDWQSKLYWELSKKLKYYEDKFEANIDKKYTEKEMLQREKNGTSELSIYINNLLHQYKLKKYDTE